MDFFCPKTNIRTAENIEALEKDKKKEKIIIKARNKAKNLVSLSFEWIKNQIAIEKKSISDAENSKGSAKNEAYLGIAPWPSKDQFNPKFPWGLISLITRLYSENPKKECKCTPIKLSENEIKNAKRHTAIKSFKTKFQLPTLKSELRPKKYKIPIKKIFLA